jgi:hypothetical protein
MENELKYSRTEFEGWTHRFKVEFETVDSELLNMDIYSNSESHTKLSKFIEERMTDKVKDYEIIYRATKEQDEADAVFVNLVLDGL